MNIYKSLEQMNKKRRHAIVQNFWTSSHSVNFTNILWAALLCDSYAHRFFLYLKFGFFTFLAQVNCQLRQWRHFWATFNRFPSLFALDTMPRTGFHVEKMGRGVTMNWFILSRSSSRISQRSRSSFVDSSTWLLLLTSTECYETSHILCKAWIMHYW